MPGLEPGTQKNNIMAKTYNKQTFTFTVNGSPVAIYCNTTDVSTGFLHHAYLCGFGRDFEHSRIKYYNRTWEAFEYESVLKAAAAKLNKAERAALLLEIETYKENEQEKYNKFFAAFERNYKELSTEQKDFLREHTPQIETKKQACAVAGVVGCMALFNKI